MRGESCFLESSLLLPKMLSSAGFLVDSVQQTSSFHWGNLRICDQARMCWSLELDGLGGKVTVLVQQEMRKRSGLGSIKEGLWGFCKMQGWKPPVKKKRGPSTKPGFHKAEFEPE